MRHAFSEFERGTVYLVKKSGESSQQYKVSFNSSKGIATIYREIEVEEGDTLVRILPNQKEEFYTVLEVNYSQKFHDIPAHYQLQLRKDASLKSSRLSSQTINIHGDNVQIGDYNSQTILNMLADVVTAIENSHDSPEAKSEAKSRLAKFLNNPTASSVLGGAAGAFAQKLLGG